MRRQVFVKHQVFFVWFLIFIIWAFYRAYFRLPEWLDEFLIKPLVFFLPVFYLVIIRRKQPLSELGLASSPKNFFTDLYLGVAIGVLFTLEGLLAHYLKNGAFSFAPLLVVKNVGIGWFFLINLSTSLWEEILGRGYLYNQLYKATKNQLWAALASSFLFLLLHVPIMFTQLHLMGSSLLIYPISILLLGITNSYVFGLRGSLTLPVLLHTFWNMTVALYL